MSEYGTKLNEQDLCLSTTKYARYRVAIKGKKIELVNFHSRLKDLSYLHYMASSMSGQGESTSGGTLAS